MFLRILSLKEDAGRRLAMQKVMAGAGLQAIFHDAPVASEMGCLYSTSSLLSRGEQACALGHIEIYREFLSSNEEWALVMEDDISLSISFKSDVQLLLQNVDVLYKEQKAVILLGGQEGLRAHFYFVGRKVMKTLKTSVYESFYSSEYLFRTCCYLINRKAAAKIQDQNSNLEYTADAWNVFIDSKALDVIALVKPALAKHPVILDSSRLQAQRTVGRKQELGVRIIKISVRLLRKLILWPLSKVM